MREANPQTIYLKDYTPPEYLIRQVELTFDLDVDNTRVSSRLTLQRNPNCPTQSNSLILLGEELTLDSVVLDGESLNSSDYQLGKETLRINAVPQHKSFALTLVNRINPKANTALEGLYLSNDMLCTQCEAEGFRKITFFLDRPDVMARFKTTLRADKTQYPVLLSNGNRIAAGELENNRHWVTWEDPFDKPCYLFALVAGKLERVSDYFTTCSGRRIELQIFVEAHDLDKCGHAMQSLQHAMQWDEQVYGREYDLDLYMVVAVSHFNMGAMENKGLNIFNTKFVLARPDTATDADYEHIEGVIGHEYFHNWTGNRITCRDWFQLSLKEGLTVFRDQEFTAEYYSRAIKRIEDVNLLRTRQFAEDAGPLAHPIRPDSYIEINNFYTLTVYEKGAEVVRMLHTLLGVNGFRKGTDLYFTRHDGQAVTCEDFVSAMEDANAVDLGQFRRWYSQAGTPELQVESHFNPANKTLTLTISQSCPDTPQQNNKRPLHIPISLGLLAADGSAMPLNIGDGVASDQLTLQLTETKQHFIFKQVMEPPVISLLRGFSAPVKLHMPRSEEELAFLLRHDSDTFNRWEAGQQLASQIILQGVTALQEGREVQVNPIFVNTWRHLLGQPWDDLAYLSLLLSLPTEAYLAEQMAIIDVEAIHHAREFVKKHAAEQLQQNILNLYRENHREESGQFNAEAVARRRIKNTCLGYLNALENATAQQLAQEQFTHANNMSDQVAALQAIVNSPHPAKTHCLDDFYRQWQNEALVVDKWFTLQATSPMPDTFAVVRELMQHTAFDLKNPNRVRSLIGAFSQANPIHFHAANGQGYQFLTTQVIALNILNPQVASRMTAALTPWRRYDSARQQMMKAELERIINSPNISRDVYEVASKSLQQ